MKSAKKKEDDEPKPHMTRRYVRDELINEIDIPIGDLDSAVERVFDEKERVYTSEFVLRDTVAIITRLVAEGVCGPATLSVQGVKTVAKKSLSVAAVKSACNFAIKKTTKKQLENVFKTAKNGIRVKTYYSGCWEEDCYCSHPFLCSLACADDFYGGSYIVYEAY